MPKSNHNAAHYFIETHLEAGRGEAIAFIEAASGKRISYSTLSANSSKVAGALTRAGIKREERAAILMLDLIDYVEVFWGCLKAGVIAVPINTLWLVPSMTQFSATAARVAFLCQPHYFKQ